MTVHGSKGLEAPVVILPDTRQLPKAPDGLLWVGDGTAKPPLAVWPVKSDYDLPILAAARGGRKRAQEQEYRRLLYVALTRAQDRLYVCGWDTKKLASPGNWYDLVGSALSLWLNEATSDLNAR